MNTSTRVRAIPPEGREDRMLTRSRARLALVAAIVLTAAVGVAAQSQTVYITAHGKKYHTSADCPSLKRSQHVEAVTFDKVGDRTLCSLCQKRDAKTTTK